MTRDVFYVFAVELNFSWQNLKINTDLNNSFDLRWDDASQSSVKKVKSNSGLQISVKTTERNESDVRINLARKFRKLMTSLDTYSQQLIKEMDDNPKTKLTTKNKAVELRSVVSQMCTVSMQAMLEDLESRNFNCARASSRCAMNRSTQTYSNEREMREAKIATNLRKEIDSCNLNEL